jgi:hypothetical protein
VLQSDNEIHTFQIYTKFLYLYILFFKILDSSFYFILIFKISYIYLYNCLSTDIDFPYWLIKEIIKRINTSVTSTKIRNHESAKNQNICTNTADKKKIYLKHQVKVIYLYNCLSTDIDFIILEMLRQCGIACFSYFFLHFVHS